ncbi:MAG: hypothetical protein C0442_11170 [Chlorobiaceae bacterium]|nr:hypothetical protein [Chlorobiaceae bacterium]
MSNNKYPYLPTSIKAPPWSNFARVTGVQIDGKPHLVFHESDPTSHEPGEVARASCFPVDLTQDDGQIFSVIHL